jgi:hypothetical protein
MMIDMRAVALIRRDHRVGPRERGDVWLRYRERARLRMKKRHVTHAAISVCSTDGDVYPASFNASMALLMD